MFFKKYGDIIVSVFFAALGIALIVGAQALPKSTIMSIGPDFMPTVIGVVTLILALILLVQSVKNFKFNAEQWEKKGVAKTDYGRVIISFICILVYTFFLKKIGFIVMTLVYLPIQIFVLAPDENRTKKDVIIYLIVDVLFTFIVFFMFRYGFKILLPAGIFTITL